MAGISDAFKQIGQLFVKKDFSPSRPASQNSATPPFDPNKYMEAWKIFLNEFFTKQVPEFFKNPGPHLQNFGTWWKAQQQGVQLAYGGVLVGSCMIVVGVVLIFV